MGKAAVFVEPYHFEMTELPTPDVEPDGILVKIRSGGICGSDLHYWRGEMKPILRGKPGPVILGHEMTGEVHSLGRGITTDSMGRPLKEGDRVVYAYFFPCRRCYICLRGELNNCPDRFRFRASIEEYPYCTGGFAEYYYLYPGHFVFKVPDELPDEAVTAANCAVSQVIYGLHQGNVRLGDSVVIQGAGGLGIYAAAAAKEMGAGLVVSIDGQAARLELATQSGADHTININDYTTPDSRVERVKELTDGWGADVVLEVVGYPEVVPEGLSMLRRGGTYVEIGNIWADSNVTLDMSKILWGVTKIVPTTHYDPYILPVALDFLVRTMDKYPLTKVMSHSFPLEQIKEAFEQAEWAGKAEGTAITRAFLTP
jgi:threonine dehydrogenase-like Zn-dependent dehydrogenase